MAHILEFTVNKQIITWTNPCRVPVENTRGVLKARFEVDEEWDGLSLIAVFQSGVQEPVDVPFSGDLVDVPPEVIRRGRLHVGLVGLGDGGSVRLTTKEMAHPVILYKSVSVDGGPPEEIAPEAWEQALAAIGDVSKLDTLDKSNLVNAINEVRRTGGGGSGGGLSFDIDNKTLVIENGVMRVNTTGEVQQNNTQPITSAAVYTTVGNISAILDTI